MRTEKPEAVLFHEVQRFRQWWVFTLVFGVATFAWIAFFEQIVGGRPWGSEPAPDWALWAIFVAFGVGLPLLFFVMRLIVDVRPDVLTVRFVPFRRRRFRPRDLKGVEAVTFRPILDWGGWGIRWAGKKGWAYIAEGTTGVRLDLADGKKLTVGTQRPKELATVLSSWASDTRRDSS